MPFTFTYLTGGRGQFILDDEGNKIIIGLNYTGTGAVGGYRKAARKPKCGAIKSFRIHHNEAGDDFWALTVNQKEFVGTYPTRDDSLEVLWGMATACNSRDAYWNVVANKQLSDRRSHIDAEPGE